VDLSAKVVCLDISNVDRALFPAVMGLLLDYIDQECTRDQERKLVFLDEAWYLLTKSASAKALAAWSRHSRHTHTGLTAISQSPLDFINNEDGKVVLTNSAMVFMAKQKTVEAPVREHFSLTASEASYLKRAKTGKDVGYSTGILVTGNNVHTPLRVVSSEKEHFFATTNPEELRTR
jgi:type IV secretory pathway VirB4 component